jgi:hypothetical protein
MGGFQLGVGERPGLLLARDVVVGAEELLVDDHAGGGLGGRRDAVATVARLRRAAELVVGVELDDR